MRLFDIRISWGPKVQPRALQGTHPPKDVPFYTEMLTYPAGVAHFLGNILPQVLARCLRTSLLEEKDSLGDRNGKLSLPGIGKAAFGTRGFVLIFFLKHSGPPSTSPRLFCHCLKNHEIIHNTPKAEQICSRSDALQAWSRYHQDFLSDCCIHAGRLLPDKCV